MGRRTNPVNFISALGFPSEILEAALRNLTFRERTVLKMRFGIDCKESHSREEIAELSGTTVGRVRWIEDKAIAKLRSIELFRLLAEMDSDGAN